MHFNSLFLLVAVALFLPSCDTDEENTSPESSIVGSWSIDDGTGSGKTTTTYQGETYVVDFTNRLVEPTDFIMNFHANGTVNSQGTLTMETTTTYNGQSEVHTNTMSDLFGEGEYEVQGNTLRAWTDQSEASEMTILTLTETELVLEASGTQTQIKDGAEARSEQTITYTCTRVL
ncbi:hypothetical protein [Lewinella sp. JB7]|uniref:hypothetical protein n=1 Tax=Lewinella sp. JB7 TaxID=2962887 RepID=UPI0020C95E77|nr:hypothetical protein [Lewinella sp. JB7]MCP9235996.1 hypothetical protein [Lewinella sp. JB7]